MKKNKTYKSIVFDAAKYFSEGDYFKSLENYKILSEKIGSNFFYANIILCERRIAKKQNNTFNYPITSIEKDPIKNIILLAKLLSRINNSTFIPKKGCIAVIGEKINSPKDISELHSHKIACKLKNHGWNTVHIAEQLNSLDHQIPLGSEEIINGIPHFYKNWSNEITPNSFENWLRKGVQIFLEWYSIYKPEAIVASGGFSSTLPAIVAAKQLLIPVFKEHLHYADFYKEINHKDFFEDFNFQQKYNIEKLCINLSDGSYYLASNVEDNLGNLLKLLPKKNIKISHENSLAILKSKEFYNLTLNTRDDGLYYIEIEIDGNKNGNPKGIVVNFKFIGENGEITDKNLNNFSSSKDFPQYYYIDNSVEKGHFRTIVFNLPPKTLKISVEIIAFNTNENIVLKDAKIGKVTIKDIARWISLKSYDFKWIKLVEPFLHKEGAISLRLALLQHNYKISKHAVDLQKLYAACDELVELEKHWIPEIAKIEKKLQLKTNNELTVLHLHKTAYPYENTGGAIRCLNTVLSQKTIGISPYIITPIGYPRSDNFVGAENKEIINGIEHFRIGANTDALRGISLSERTRYATFYSAKILKIRGANIIHAASGVRGYELALQAIALKKLSGLPFLYEVRSFHEHTWSTVRDDVMELEKTQLRIIKENFCMAEADFITTISFSMKNILIERGISPNKIEVIPNAIDEKKYLGRDIPRISIPALKGADVVVGYISNMSIREGHKYLINAIHKLRINTGKDIRGLFVGDGPERKNLLNLAINLGIENEIVFTGEVDHNEINSYYKAIDIFVVPRIPDYAADWVTPLKPYEAMALDLPIIVSDLPALKEIVGEHEERGLIAQPANVDSLITQLLRYIKDPLLKRRKITAAREWVFAERTWSANAKRYDSIYRRMIEKNNKF